MPGQSKTRTFNGRQGARFIFLTQGDDLGPQHLGLWLIDQEATRTPDGLLFNAAFPPGLAVTKRAGTLRLLLPLNSPEIERKTLQRIKRERPSSLVIRSDWMKMCIGYLKVSQAFRKSRERFSPGLDFHFKYFEILFGFIKSICHTCSPKTKTEMKPYAHSTQRSITMGNGLCCDDLGYWPGKS